MTKTTAPDGMAPAFIAAGFAGALFTVGAFSLFSSMTGISVLVGAVLALSNLYVLSRIVRTVVVAPAGSSAQAEEGASPREASPGPSGSRFSVPWGALAVVKMLVLFGGTWLLMTRGLVEPLGLVLGYGAMPIGIAASTLRRGLAPR